ncbi:MAG: sigma factor-like helix-turn-helix DNA-binding protein, partial [Anaerolineae bacterium]
DRPQARHCTPEEVARALGVSHQRAQQIEKSALRKLRRWCAQHGLRMEDLIG